MNSQIKSATRLRVSTRAAGAVAGVIMLASAAYAFTPESTDQIHVAQHDWAGSEFSTQLAVRLLQEAGYNADAVNPSFRRFWSPAGSPMSASLA